jgi:hypothetical protein
VSRKKLFAILAAESVAIIALYVLTAQMQETFSAIYNFPFEQIGLGLRALHGLGGFGVGAAFALWIGFSLLPMIPAVCDRRKSAWEKALLGLVSFSLLTTLYVMTDPQCIELPYTDSDYIVKTSFSMTTWSALILYFIVFAVRLMREGDRDKLMDYFGMALYALAMLCAACIIILGTGSAQNIRFSNRQTVDTVFALLQFSVAALPYVLDIMIVIHVGELADAVRRGKKLTEKADRLTKLCCVSLIVPSAATVGFNFLQEAFINVRTYIAVSLNIPVFSVVFTLFALLLTRLLIENRRLRDDNDLFI